MTSAVAGSPLPESLCGPCRRLRYHETHNSKVQSHAQQEAGVRSVDSQCTSNPSLLPPQAPLHRGRCLFCSRPFPSVRTASLGNLWLWADPDCAQVASPHRSDPFCPAPCRPAATRRENTMTVQCAANCVRSRTLAVQCGGAVYLRSPGRTRATELEYPWLCAWSSSTSLRAAGLHTHVLTHRTSRDPADLHTYVYLYMKREEEECCSGYFRNPGLKRTFG